MPIFLIIYQIMQNEPISKNCTIHTKPLRYICLDQQCQQNLLLCEDCNSNNSHKHSKTTIEDIEEIKNRLVEKWDKEPTAVKCRKYLKRVKQFYDKMRKEVIQLLNQDQRIVESHIQRISLHHLPVEANSLTYLQIKNNQYEKLDKGSLLKLIQEAESGEPNKNLEQQKDITNLLDLELSKCHQKLMTLKYVLLSKKIEAQLLSPQIKQNSKICQHDQFSKIYAVFSSKNLVIRSAKLLYRGSDAAFSDKKYYNSCNNQLNTLTLLKLSNGRKVGGFSSIPLVYHDQNLGVPDEQIRYAEDNTRRSFILNLTNLSSYDLKNYKKAVGYKKNAIGPIFGQDLNASAFQAESNLGNAYQCPQGLTVNSMQTKVFLLSGYKVKIDQMEIWQLSF